MKKNILIPLVLIILVGAGAFFSGMQFQKSQASQQAGGTQQDTSANPARTPGGGRRGGFGRATVGKIVSQDANSITIQMTDGSSKIINISDATKLSKIDSAAKTDLTTNQTVAVFGSTNSDGSITAQRIQLNPVSMRGPSTTPGQ